MQRQPALIRHYRELSGLTREELATLIDVSPNTVSNYERQGAPSSKLFELARVFVTHAAIRDYGTAQEFWSRCGSRNFPEPPELRRLFADSLTRSYRSSRQAPTVTIVDHMAYIPAGPFLQGSTLSQLMLLEQLCVEACTECKWDYFEDELPQREVTLSAFYIDVYEVTNEKFQQFVDDTGHVTTAENNQFSYVWDDTGREFVRTPGVDWCRPRGPGSSIEGLMNYPVVHVSWLDASAYCTWAGKRLPTEAEWEKAARGPAGWLFPWGNDWDPDAGNYVTVSSDGTSHVNGLSEVGQYAQGMSPYGVHDLLGNVSEWVADMYDPDYYQTAPNRNPLNTTAPRTRPIIQHSRRGGGWATRPGFLHAAWRIDRPDQTNDVLGFRCARYP